jgi:uncharacterized membrane protein
MPEANSAEWRTRPSRSDNQTRVPFTTRLLLCQSLAACRDVTPSDALGRVIPAALMLGAIGCLGVITAPATASLVESSRRRFAAGSASDVGQRRGELNARQARIEAAVTPALSGGSSDGVS